MSGSKRESTEFNVLDAILLASIRRPHRICAIAAMILSSSSSLASLTDRARSIAELLTSTEDQELKLVTDVMKEVQHQFMVRVSRQDTKRKALASSKMGSDLLTTTRINRVCKHIFGDTSEWMSVRGTPPKVRGPFFNWLHRDSSDVLVAGVDASMKDELITGFVFKGKGASQVRFGRLPTRANNIDDLMACLGLHSKFVGDKSIKVDWSRRVFLLSGTNRLPWVYP